MTADWRPFETGVLGVGGKVSGAGGRKGARVVAGLLGTVGPSGTWQDNFGPNFILG